jgi:leucyl-tRNA synthetase
VNGKFRGKWELPKGETKESLLKAVQEDEKMRKHIIGEIAKVVFVPEKLLNIVTK